MIDFRYSFNFNVTLVSLFFFSKAVPAFYNNKINIFIICKKHDFQWSTFVHTHAPGCTLRPATASPTPHNGPIHHSREWVLWTHPLVSRMGVQWQACLTTASNPELWHSVSVLLLNVVLYASCCQQVHIWGQFKATHHHSPTTDDNGSI